MAQRGENGFGDAVPVLAAELGMAAPIGGQQGIGRALESKHFGKDGGGVGKAGGCHKGKQARRAKGGIVADSATGARFSGSLKALFRLPAAANMRAAA